MTRSTFDFVYESPTALTEKATYLVFDSSDEGLHAIALPPRPLEVETDRSVDVDGRLAPTIPFSVVQRLAMGFARRVGLRAAAVLAVGRLLEGGATPLGRERCEADLQEIRIGLGKLDQKDVEVRGLAHLVAQAGEGHYVPFVVLGSPAGKSFRNVAVVRQKHHPVRPVGYLQSVATGAYRASQEFYITQGHASHIYVRPPPGTLMGQCRLPGHWRTTAVESVPRGRLWYVHVRQRAKVEIADARRRERAERGSPAWNARISFLLPPTPHVLLGVVFLLLSAGSFWLGTRTDPATTQKLLSLDALAGSITLPILWGYRENDIAVLHVGGRAILLGVFAAVWLTLATGEGAPPTAAWATLGAGLALGAVEWALALRAARESLK